jgi:hypothetical protein
LLFNQKANGMLNEKEFRVIYNEYLESGLTVRDYCLNQKITESKFFYWQHRLKGLLPPKSGFVPIIFGGDQQEPSPHLPVSMKDQPELQINQNSNFVTLSCEISYPNGICIKVNGLTDLEMVRSLLVSTHR